MNKHWTFCGLLAAAWLLTTGMALAFIGFTGDYSNDAWTIDYDDVWSSSYYVGDSGTNNILTISGNGSLMLAGSRDFVIGQQGHHNATIVEGLLFVDTANRNLRIGGATGPASHNELLVDGGTVSNFVIRLGDASFGTGNVMRVLGGGLVYSPGYVIVSPRADAEESKLVVSGEDSRVIAGTYFNVGNSEGTRNNVARIEDGGSLVAGTYARIGRYGTNNVLSVSGGGSLDIGTYFHVGVEATTHHTQVTVEGEGSSLTVGGEAVIGQAGNGHVLTLDDGGRMSVGAAIGLIVGELQGADSNRVTVSSGAVLDNTSGAGELRIGGSGAQGGSYSEVLVDGGTITNMRIRLGDGGTSTGNVMRVLDGGEVHAPGYVIVAPRAGSAENLLVVSGAASRVATEGYFSLGNNVASPNNVVRIEDGGALSAEASGFVGRHSTNNQLLVTGGGTFDVGTNLRIGESADSGHSLLEVDGDGSRAGVGALMTVGASDYNILRVRNQGVLRTDGDSFIGIDTGAGNQVIVTGSGSLWTNAGAITVRGEDNAVRIRDAGLLLGDEVNVESEGAFEIDGATAGLAASLAVEEGGQLLLTGSGSKMHVGAGAMNVINDFSANRLVVAAGGTVTADGLLDLGAGGILAVETGGIVQGSGLILGHADVAGALRPGRSPGLLTFEGDVTLRSSSTVHIELGGTEPGASDHLQVTGQLAIEGSTLAFSLLEGYDPGFEDVIHILSAHTSGTFDYDTSALPAGWSVDTQNLYTEGSVTLVPPPFTGTRTVIEGALTFAAGSRLYMHLGGPGEGESDLVVADAITIEGGTLHLMLLEDYEPTDGDLIPLFQSDALTGTFAAIDDSALPAGWKIDAEPLPTEGSVRIIADTGPVDTDGDGIPDWWEIKYFDGPTNAVAGAYSDQSGFTNLEKYIAGLEPFNDDSAFLVAEESVLENGQLVLRWPSVEGRVYSVDAAMDLGGEEAFTPLAGAEALPATPPVNEYTVDVEAEGSPVSFYRVRVRLE